MWFVMYVSLLCTDTGGYDADMLNLSYQMKEWLRQGGGTEGDYSIRMI